MAKGHISKVCMSGFPPISVFPTDTKFPPSPRLARVMHANVLKKRPPIPAASLKRVVCYSKHIDDGGTINEVSLRPSPSPVPDFLQRVSRRIKKGT